MGELTREVTARVVQKLPKVLLHDHLDGGLRPSTILDLAQELGYVQLPTSNSQELATWFANNAHTGSLPNYLAGFKHTCAVLQTKEALQRVSAEAIEDLAADGVVYAEIRFAPELHQKLGLTGSQTVKSVLDGVAAAIKKTGAKGQNIQVGVILCAMREFGNWDATARLAVEHRDDGVVGFDVAGPEKGFPLTKNLDVFRYLRRNNVHFTVHAGEAYKIAAVWDAVSVCGAERLGHGLRLVDDIHQTPSGSYQLGQLAQYIRDRRIPLEMCPTSNIGTGSVPNMQDHPVDLLRDLRFRVTINTDNRLMSATNMTNEFLLLCKVFGYNYEDILWFTVNAAKSCFAPFDKRCQLINDIIFPQFKGVLQNK